MKYDQKEFSEELLKEIRNIETTLKDNIDFLLLKYRPIFNTKNLVFDGEFHIQGDHPFTPQYVSSISIGISEEKEELIDLHTIKIWECYRSFLGMPISKKIPGSKIVGELLDETLEEVKEELVDCITDLLAA
ncbi:hypothetical protein ABE65_012405 [Fictibacillus phosphorivorans]|uniref:Uncharacterized protein n=1 Tax=Fictibacillus phosphorivorans TaxID=1221500 RepID=A0A168W2C5_9BACL|nr:hypothetical protein [Fictibacillus phosphorivorans]ANC77555.1 hypothetical protein ABE65_012405 [Fictibacillus phosphorivorans]